MQVFIVTYLLLQLLKSDDGCQEFNPHEFSVATTVVSVDVLDSIVFVSPVHTSSTTQSLFQASKNASQQSLNFTVLHLGHSGRLLHILCPKPQKMHSSNQMRTQTNKTLSMASYSMYWSSLKN